VSPIFQKRAVLTTHDLLVNRLKGYLWNALIFGWLAYEEGIVKALLVIAVINIAVYALFIVWHHYGKRRTV